MKKHLLCILSLVLLLSLFSFVGCNSGKDIHVHKFTTSVVDATCTTAGEKVYICECGKTDVVEIPALGHTVVIDEAVEATCTETGLTEGSHCSRCGDTLVAQEVIGATGHTYEDSNECNVCGHIDTQYFIFTLLSDDTYEVKAKDVNNIPAHVVIPSEYDNRAVTEIGWGAFSGSDNLRSIVIPNSIRRISAVALAYCNGLTSVNIPDSVTLIDMNVFDRCYNLTSITVDENNAKYKDIEGNLYSKDGKTLIQYAIGKLETSFIILDNVTHIGRDALAFSINLTTIVIPDSVISIGDYALYHCDNLASVVIGEGVVNIGKAAFYCCERLTNIEVNKNNKNYKDIDGNLYSKDGTVLIQYVMGNTAKSFTVPDSITTIGDYALAHNDRLESFVVGNNVIFIGERAFHNTYFSTIVIGGNVTSVGSDAFSDCYYLTSVFYSGTVDGWQEVTIDVGNDYLLNATRYYYSEQHPTTEGNFWHYDENGEIAVWCYNPVIDSAVEPTCTETGLTEGSHCETCGDTLVAQEIIPALPHTYEDSNQCSVCGYIDTQFFTFSLLSDDTYEVKAKDVNNIPGNIAIPSVYNSKSVSAIGSYAFYECSSLIKIEIFDSVTSVGNNAFDYCYNLNEIKVSENNSNYKDIDGNLYSKDGEILIQYAIGKKETTFTTPACVKSIGSYAFHNCANLTEIVILDNVESIAGAAFEGCTSLYMITIPFVGNMLNSTTDAHFGYIFGATESNGFYYNEDYVPASLKIVKIIGGTSIGSAAFLYCSSLTEIVIPDSVKSIGYRAFHNCSSLTEIVIPDSVTSIGDNAFTGCTRLKNISIPDSVTSIGNDAFRDCESLVNILLPKSITIINDCMFDGCTSLESVIIPTGVTSIGKWAFRICPKLKYIIVDANNSYYKSIDGSLYTKDGTRLIKYATGNSAKTFVIPDSVTSVDEFAFYNCVNLTEIIVPDSVISIGEHAFFGCNNLTNVKIGSGLESISEGVFSNCSNLTKIIIETGVKTIEMYAFSRCENLKEIIIPESVTSIASYAFSGCTGLKEIIIPNGVTVINECTFLNCVNLTEIIIPDSVTSIAENAFDGCDNLQYNEYENALYLGSISNPYLFLFRAKEVIITTCEINNNCKYIHHNAFKGCDRLTEIVIPNSVTSIGSFAFSYCSSLTEIVIPNSVTSIGSFAFSYCSSLTKIVIPESVTSIGGSAFSGCSSLTSITIPFVGAGVGNTGYPFGYIFGTTSYTGSEAITQYYITQSIIGNTTYYGSTTYYIPSSLKSVTVTGGDICYGAFGNCSSLTEIVITNGVKSIDYRAFENCISLTEIAIPDSVTSIDTQAFYGCSSLLTVNFGENSQLTSIGVRAFEGCSSLTEIVIPDSVTSIGDDAFYGCDNLQFYVEDSLKYLGNNNNPCLYLFGSLSTDITTAKINENCKIIGYSAFSGCDSLTEIIIPDSVTSIGGRAFEGCSSLKSIAIPFIGENKDGTGSIRFSYIFGSVPTSLKVVIITGGASIGDQTFLGCDSLTEIIIPDSVTSIGDSAFSGCSSLTEIVIPDSVISIGLYAFSGCTSLVTVNFEKNSQLTSIGDSAFSRCSSLVTVNFGESSQLTSIGDSAFSGCSNLTEIVIPDDVISIGLYAFSGCSNLAEIKVSKNNANYKNIDGNLYSKDGKTLIQYAPGKQETAFYILDSVTGIGDCAFYGCSSLVTVNFGENSQLTSIGWSTFSHCDSLTEIAIPDTVKVIGDHAFSYCESLTNVIFGENSQLTVVGNYGFNSCSSLTKIVIPDGVTRINFATFAGCKNLTNVFYKGTESDWSQITIESGNKELTNATVYYYSEQAPTEEGNFWDYDENGEIAVWGAQG